MRTEPDWNILLTEFDADIEEGIWTAIYNEIDFDSDQLEYLRRNQGIRERVWDCINAAYPTTEANQEFLEAFISQPSSEIEVIEVEI